MGSGHVYPHHKKLTKNRYMKNWRTHKHGFEAVKCRLLNNRPVLNLTFSKKVQEGGSNTCEIAHILAIVVAQTKELLYMLDRGGSRLFTNGCHLGRVRTDLAMANYIARVIDLTLKKCSFPNLCI